MWSIAYRYRAMTADVDSIANQNNTTNQTHINSVFLKISCIQCCRKTRFKRICIDFYMRLEILLHKYF